MIRIGFQELLVLGATLLYKSRAPSPLELGSLVSTAVLTEKRERSTIKSSG